MIRPATIAMLVLAFGAVAVLFHVSYLVSELAGELARVNREIERDGEETHVLRAEWSFLNQPARLRALTARYLDLVPLDPAQLVPVAAVPARPVELPMLVGAAVLASSQAKPAVLAGRPKTKPRPPTVAVATHAAPAPPARRVPPQVAAVDASGLARTLADVLADLRPDEARR